MINKIVFAAGGTGGHIFPAIAVADELKKENENVQIKFIGAKGRIEEKIVPQNGYELVTIDLMGFSRSWSPKNIRVVFKFMKAAGQAKRILKEFCPDIVFGTGGFISGPVLWSASKLGITSVIQEGNSYPGLTVKWLSGKVDKVILNFDETKRYLKRQDNIEISPYPVRTRLKRLSKDEALKFFNLKAGFKTLFIFGGSQGARSLNLAVSKCIENFPGKNIQVIWQTGETFFSKAVEYENKNENIKVLKFIDRIDYAYSAADLIVCRAGISTVMELAGFGAAAVFVPFPQASENHQEKNAMTLVQKQAAEMIVDDELDEKLEPTVIRLINDDETMNKMKTNIKQFADAGAAVKIKEMLNKLIDNSKN